MLEGAVNTIVHLKEKQRQFQKQLIEAVEEKDEIISGKNKVKNV